MSEQARTVKELLASMEKHTVAAHKEVTKDEPEAAARNDGFWMGVTMAHSKLDPILDAYIIPGANAIVSAEGLGAATKVFAKWALPNDLLWGEMNDAAKEQARLITVHILEAAGIVVVDKVVEISEELPGREGQEYEACITGLKVKRGDTLYVKREKNDE